MENKMTKQQKYMIGKKNIVFAVNEALYNDFKQQLEIDGLSQKEVLETAIQQYLNGIMVVDKTKMK